MTSDTLAQITSAAVAIIATIAWRLVDRYLPDPHGRYPLPRRPGMPLNLPEDEPAHEAPPPQEQTKAHNEA